MPKKTAVKKTKIDKAKAAKRVRKIFPILEKTYPEAKIALNFVNPLELLMATILSACRRKISHGISQALRLRV